MAGLTATTIVPARPGDGGEPFRVFGPGDDVPEWAARQMGAHLFEGGKHPHPDSDAEPGAVAERPPGAEPPRKGKGSGRDAWVAFAAEKEFELDGEPSRDEIIELMVNARLIAAEQ